MSERAPFAYAYRYPAMFGRGKTTIYFSDGREINGSRPLEAIPLFTLDQIVPPDDQQLVERVARAIIDPSIEHHVSQIQGFLYGAYHVIRDCTKAPEDQELSRTIFEAEHDERFELERAKVIARAAIAAVRSR